ncbi:hypothetical protein [Alteraurantiacibacter aquimixticola]|uniref:Uncharacterized protein n=1 Tax=Alteraurantiacibacter aquimixticola TaxID=2489173 RepID=A0A4T3F1T5_9SPHN|nr:hypothetical protein [Alteraurantiacibacter aquimixticola]TIX49365.1 hypothetical protein E5222_10930 [Alteraurantiacibacter aquimixticola]
MSLAAIGATILAVLFLIGLARWLGFAGKPQLTDEAEAAALAASLPGGFAARDIALDCVGHGALLADADGRVAVIIPHGAHFMVRLAGPGLSVTRDATGITLVDPLWKFQLAIEDDQGFWIESLEKAIAAA